MNVMLIGGGGREHALIKKLKENPEISALYALPGNGGIALDAKCVSIKANEKEKIVQFALDNKIEFAVIAPDDPLVAGLVDDLEAIGIKCFGPDKKAAAIEGSKVFSKSLMKKYGIPTAFYEAFDDYESAKAYVKEKGAPIVIKADGLALGKGVVVALSVNEAQDALKEIMLDKVFGESGNSVVIEQFLTGPEVSVLAFTDGKTIVPMISSMDHKRALDDDMGLNTGGMGTIAPNPYYTKEIADRCMKEIFLPTINAMNAEGRSFKGCLFFGLMITEEGPKVIEYNCRFGDPETQVVLPLLKTDLFTIMQAVRDERLGEINVEFSDECACCVVLASSGYPQKYETGFPITVEEDFRATLYCAGVKSDDAEKMITSGGRVLGVSAIGANLGEAINKAYEQVQKVHFENAYFRKDIGAKALLVREE